MKQAYLGDGLYAEFDGYQFRLYASDGIRVTNEVFLEPEVLDAFMEFVASVRAKSGTPSYTPDRDGV